MILDHPGCYGLPTAVSANSVSCSACPSRSGCLHAAFLFLETLPDNPLTRRERLALAVTRRALTDSPPTVGGAVNQSLTVASSRGVKQLTLTQAQLDMLGTFPARVASQLRELMRRGWFDFAKTELRAGRNPADKGWKKVFCDYLLAGGCTRPNLELALVEQLNLSAGSARMQVSVGVAIFAAGRLATEQFGQFTLLPN